MRRYIPYFVIFLGIIAFSKAMSLLNTNTSLVEVNKIDAAETEKPLESKIDEKQEIDTKIMVTNQNSDPLFNFYNIDTSQIKKIDSCNQLYDLKFSPEEVQILQVLRSRYDKLQEIETDLQIKNDTLNSIQGEIDKKLEQLANLNLQMTNDNSSSANKNYNKLVKIYEGMKPKEAAKIFDTLQTQIILGVAQQMKENKLAAIVAEMTPEKARDLTMGLANRM
jgi:flagellar motility protein MotE (MotC chaperone)